MIVYVKISLSSKSGALITLLYTAYKLHYMAS